MSNAPVTLSIEDAAAALGRGVEARHVRARLLRGTLEGERGDDGEWRVLRTSIDRSLGDAPTCGGCELPSTTFVIVKYPSHDRVEFALCDEHGEAAERSYGRQGQVLEVVCFAYQGEGWIRPVPRS